MSTAEELNNEHKRMLREIRRALAAKGALQDAELRVGANPSLRNRARHRIRSILWRRSIRDDATQECLDVLAASRQQLRFTSWYGSAGYDKELSEKYGEPLYFSPVQYVWRKDGTPFYIPQGDSPTWSSEAI